MTWYDITWYHIIWHHLIWHICILYMYIYIHYIFGSLATVFLRRLYCRRGLVDFPTKKPANKQLEWTFLSWEVDDHYPTTTPPPKTGPTKKFVVLKKCRSVVLAMKAFGTRTIQVTRMGCVKIDLGNGNFTTQRDESGRCFNQIFLQFFTFFKGCGGKFVFFKHFETFSTHTRGHFGGVGVGASKQWGTCRKNTPLEKENHLNQTIIFKFNMLNLPGWNLWHFFWRHFTWRMIPGLGYVVRITPHLQTMII